MSSGTPLVKSSASKHAKEKDEIGQNIQVFVRCRPINKAEKDKKAFSIVDIPSIKQIDVKEKPNTNMTKSYQFDRVFGPKSQQMDVYKSVVEPLIEQVMMGYNCTVFAYGQTGTGKTFTMEGGEKRNTGLGWDQDPTSGIIPRALAQILDSLKEQSDQLEYSVKISFLELYNEEIFDLLSAVDDTSKLRLYEDAYKKGSVIIQGLEEVQVHTKAQVYSILERGSEKRKTAETMMNAHSSRSHTVFTVTVHIKEAMLEEEVLRIGKLNLVDLAGAENIGRSGAKDSRAREAGNINQSLLTLGRVITNLVERAPHIPYRESKLTRLLQDSLGGRTKTSIIATVSPATINLEETLSTLDYAYRARSILNRPEINAKLSKDDLVKEYSNEMDKIRKDILQLREKSGLWIAQENFLEMREKIEQHEVQISEKTKQMIALKEEMDKKKALFEEVEANMIRKSREIQKVRDQLEVQEEKLAEVSTDLKKTVRDKEEQVHLVSKHVETEHKLGMQAKKLQVGCDDMDDDLDMLYKKLDTVKAIDTDNVAAKDLFQNEFDTVVTKFCSRLEDFGKQHESLCNNLQEDLKSELTIRANQTTDLITEIQALLQSNMEIGSKVCSSLDSEQSKLDNLSSKVDEFGENVNAQEKGKGNEYLQRMAPSLQLISEKVTAQVKALELFSTHVNENFEKVRSKVKEDTIKIVEIVREIDAVVKANLEYEEESVGKIHALNARVVQSHKNIKVALETLDKAYHEHNSVVDSLASNLEGVITNLADQVSPLKEKINSKVDQLNGAMDSLEVEVSACVDQNKKQTRKSVEECEGIAQDIVAAKEKLESNSSTYVTESAAEVEEVFKMTEEALTERNVSLVNQKTEVKETSEKAKEEFNKSQQKVDSKLNLKLESTIDSHLSDVVSLSKVNIEELKENVGEISSKVNDHVNDGIIIYQPTGQTPVRQERQYPRYLAATSPHQRILGRFRKTVEAEEAAKNSVEDSMDSAVSDSFRSNMTAEESSLRERTGSFSSDINETESVTSSVGSKKRELKKPEAIKRNILSNSNVTNK